MSIQSEIDRIVGGKTAIATAIEGKGVTVPEGTLLDGMAPLIESIETGGSSTPGTPGDIMFYDYDGTIVTSWTLAELATKTALPDYPSHNGLICQGWNWSLADLKTANRKMNVGAMYITDDGKTRIYIHLEEGRTSPVLGVCPNGTVDIDWGDGTVHDTLTGSDTSTAVYTSAHSYAAPGDYVIQLTVTGSMGFGSNGLLVYTSNSDDRNSVYRNAIRKVELGSGVTSIGDGAFSACFGIARLYFLPTTPPSVSSSNAFIDIPTDCIIHVPVGSLNAYTSATNYPSSSTYTYVEDVV